MRASRISSSAALISFNKDKRLLNIDATRRRFVLVNAHASDSMNQL